MIPPWRSDAYGLVDLPHQGFVAFLFLVLDVLHGRAIFFEREYLDPVVVGIVDEVEPHVVILEADAAHRTVVFTDGVVVSGHAQAEVAFVFAQFMGRCGVVAQPGEFEP